MIQVKGSSIIIKTEQDVQELDSKLAQVQLQYLPFVVSTLTTLINVYIVDPIHDTMRAANVSQKVIERTYLDVHAEANSETITFSIKSDYLSDTGFDVARMIEYGRRAYLVVPKFKLFLSWISKKTGKRILAKQSHIPEKPALKAIFNAIVMGQPKVQKELNKRTKTWLSEILKS